MDFETTVRKEGAHTTAAATNFEDTPCLSFSEDSLEDPPVILKCEL